MQGRGVYSTHASSYITILASSYNYDLFYSTGGKPYEELGEVVETEGLSIHQLSDELMDRVLAIRDQ